MSELSTVMTRTAVWTDGWAQPTRTATTQPDRSAFGGRSMAWEDQGERDPRVSNLSAALWKLAALGLSASVLLAIVTLVWLLVS